MARSSHWRRNSLNVDVNNLIVGAFIKKGEASHLGMIDECSLLATFSGESRRYLLPAGWQFFFNFQYLAFLTFVPY